VPAVVSIPPLITTDYRPEGVGTNIWMSLAFGACAGERYAQLPPAALVLLAGLKPSGITLSITGASRGGNSSSPDAAHRRSTRLSEAPRPGTPPQRQRR